MRRILPVLLLVAVACGTGGSAPRRADNAARPNVLLVVTDDERFDSHEATPQLYEWFSEGGTIFRRAYVTTPHCCPSRASIFSGRYVHNHGVRHQNRIGQFDHAKTVQHDLRRAGYRTGFVGKFLNGWRPDQAPPHFQRWTVGEGYSDAPFVADGRRVTASYGPSWVFQRARTYLDDWEEAADDDPWLLMISTFGPHDPVDAAPRYEDERFEWDGNPATKESDRADKPPYVRQANYSEGFGIEKRQAQFRVLRSVDDAFAKTIEHLDALGELENTLVIYMSDNGYMWAEHGLIAKGVPYDGATRVPMYVRGPGIEAGTSDRLVANIDVAPTIYDVTGIEPSYELDGRPIQGTEPREALLLEYAGGRVVPEWWSLVTPRDQLTEYADGFIEYYDLEADPYQLTNDGDAAPPGMLEELRRAKTCQGIEACP